ncbi:MAG: hypothetical protein ACREV5_01080 [Steroidobacter sp.]
MSTDAYEPTGRVWPTRGVEPAALAALARDLPASELWSLLLFVAEQRAAVRKPAGLLQQYEQDRFVGPACVDQRTQLEFDRHLFAAAGQFEALELAPMAPLGVCSVIAPTSQNRVVTTVRGAEVVSDPTNVLALESARRLRADPASVVKLATSHRCVRAQAVPKQPGFAAHFRLFCLTSAGREAKDQAFTVDSFVEHVRVHLSALDRLERHGYLFPNRAIQVLSTDRGRALAERIIASLSDVSNDIAHQALTKTYYDGLRFTISARSSSGATVPLIDGGAFDWVAKLAANRKFVFVASAIGSQLAAQLFRTSISTSE